MSQGNPKFKFRVSSDVYDIVMSQENPREWLEELVREGRLWKRPVPDPREEAVLWAEALGEW